eukprot:TRINITY_DN32782_c0_g1_i1.p1 TRINITY_DN32782_c0_g1~~TRINITY_DN32782_c0_g1_i1.p1  ORF type:complete len:138 (-),score=18.79 TRINITY_DN32782_c0_g1_i1:55-468(-)
MGVDLCVCVGCDSRSMLASDISVMALDWAVYCEDTEANLSSDLFDMFSTLLPKFDLPVVKRLILHLFNALSFGEQSKANIILDILAAVPDKVQNDDAVMKLLYRVGGVLLNSAFVHQFTTGLHLVSQPKVCRFCLSG